MNNKYIAAIAGVLYYLQEEKRGLPETPVYNIINRWSMHGRQTIMKLRTRAQLRTLDSGMYLPFLNHTTWNNGRIATPVHRIKNLAAAQNRLKTRAQIRKAQIQHKRGVTSPGKTVPEGQV